MKRMMITALLGLTAACVISGCGAGREDSLKDEYAAGWTNDRALETDGQADGDDYDPETGLYNPDGGYYYGSTERHSILTDPDDYEPGNGW